MKFINEIIKKYGVDKLLHFLGGGWIVSIFIPFEWISIILGILLMLIASFIKEKWFDNTFDKNDIIAACIGGTTSIITYLIIKLILIIL